MIEPPTHHSASMERETVTWETVDCPLCGLYSTIEEAEGSASASNGPATSHYLTTSDYFYGVPGKMTLQRCTRCGHIYLNPRPAAETIFACYPSHYAQYTIAPSEAAAVEPARPWYARPPLRWIPGLRWLYYALTNDRGYVIPERPVEARKALEIGCGTGNFLLKLRDAGWTAEGLEPSLQAAELARGFGFSVAVSPLEAASYPVETFDAVFAWMVVEHLHDPLEALCRIHDWLKPGGVICLSVPNVRGWEARVFGRYWQGLDAPRHLQHFTPLTIQRMLQRLRYEGVEVIHQRNVRSGYASLAAWIRQRRPKSSLANRLQHWFDAGPPLGWHLLLSPLAFLLASLHRAGRITVIAKKPTHT